MNKHIFLIGIISSSIFGCDTPTAPIKYGAGILPLVYNQINQQYYFLLGKENCHDGYYSHGTYSDFGGESKAGENFYKRHSVNLKRKQGFLIIHLLQCLIKST